jgi:hypothetical protein
MKSKILASCAALLFILALWASGACAQERSQLGPAIRAVEPSSDLLRLINMPPPLDLAFGAEIIVVSGYEPHRSSGQDTSVRVVVDRPGSKVLLVLTSYDKVLWKVDATPTTTVTGIVVSGYQEPSVSTRLPVRAWRARLPYVTKTDNSNFQSLLASLRRMFGVERIDVLRASYSIPVDIAIRSLDPKRDDLTVAGPRPEPPRRPVQFKLLSSDFTAIPWSLTGPVDEKATYRYLGEGKVAISPSLQKRFQLVSDRLEMFDLRNGAAVPIADLPPNFPAFSWPMDITYDTRRDMVVVVSLGGEGFLYRFDAKNQRWVDFRSMRDIDVFALAYDQKLDRYVGWTSSGGLIFIDAASGAVMQRRVVDRLTAFGRLYDGLNRQPPRLTIVPQGDDIMLVYIEAGQVRRIWHYDVQTDSVEFTYSAEPISTRNPSIPIKN